jgi:DNA mismatch repair protein MutS
VYRPYTAIYSRILGNDDLFKGLSTFAVEMSELRVILKMADANSLILGDEICSGTETESALSIFVAALGNLHTKNSSFIFATHFHEIVRYDEIKTLTNMALYHMAVVFDRAADCLVYDRKLQPGSGNRMYGLEVCRSLYLDDEFLETAYKLRTKYFPENRGELSHTTAIYNAKKVRGLCEICRTELAEEIHHIAQQKDASANGFIGTFQK